ncbi:MAG: glycine zipper 2TM domain-containing protein [Asticcacaulis sp.]|nr:glycine zipper 2TM domain-containing protein [Asticcacaulis sp.]
MTKMMLAAGAAAILALGVTPAAQAQYAQDTQYDGYCYAKKESAKNTGTAVGAVAGGLLGSQVSKNERGLGAIVGAVAGGALGRTVAASTVKCLNGEYYSYESGYYTPMQPPEGYDVVYYKQRPSTNAYSVVYYDTARHTSPAYAYNGNNNGGYNNGSSYDNGYGQPYQGGAYQPSNNQAYNTGMQGWRDNKGAWHTGRPVALGWKDSKGYWHEGQVATYGWKDNNGAWHEDTAPSYGYNTNGYYNGGNN